MSTSKKMQPRNDSLVATLRQTQQECTPATNDAKTLLAEPSPMDLNTKNRRVKSAHLSPRPILYADHDPLMRRLAGIILSRAGYPVRTAVDGEETLTALRHEDHDLLITEYDIPDSNGLELIQTLRQENILIPVVLVSNTLNEIPAIDSLRLGFVATLAKPFSIEGLVTTVRAALSSICLRWTPDGLSRLPNPSGTGYRPPTARR